MKDMTRMLDVICDEIEKIAEKGLTTSNLETAYKLIDMYKDLKTVEGMEGYEGYSGYDGEYSGRGRRRDSMGRYTSSYNDGYSGNRYSGRDGWNDHGYSGRGDKYARYLDQKESYRSNKSADCKQRLMDTLEDYMQDFTMQMEQLARDSDCAEERSTIRKYIDKLKTI